MGTFRTLDSPKLWSTFNQPDYYWLTRPLAVFLISRFTLFWAAFIAHVAFPDAVGEGYWHATPDNFFLDGWARWDSGWYFSIVENGYAFVPGQQSSVAFFPLYPLMISMLKPLTGGALSAGLLVSNLSLLGMLIMLYKLTYLEFQDHTVATRAVFYVAVFPTAFFLSSVYTESTFLLLTVSALYFARRHLWIGASLTGMLCSATRVTGILLWGVVILEWLKTQGWTISTLYRHEAWHNFWYAVRTDYINLLIISLIPLGLISYMLFLWVKFDDPLAFIMTQRAWDHHFYNPWRIVIRSIGHLLHANLSSGKGFSWNELIDLTAVLTVLAAVVPIWRRLGESYALYSLLNVLIPVATGIGSMSRYILLVFPLFMMLAWWGRRPLLDRAIMISFCVILGVLTAVFVNWYFVA